MLAYAIIVEDIKIWDARVQMTQVFMYSIKKFCA
jgi:hypothetical protein